MKLHCRQCWHLVRVKPTGMGRLPVCTKGHLFVPTRLKPRAVSKFQNKQPQKPARRARKKVTA